MSDALSTGRIVKVAGPVVDVEFPPDALPEINFAVEFDITIGGESETIVGEVAQIAQDSGFGSAEHMITIFKRHVGTTPNRYRMSVRGR